MPTRRETQSRLNPKPLHVRPNEVLEFERSSIDKVAKEGAEGKGWCGGADDTDGLARLAAM